MYYNIEGVDPKIIGWIVNHARANYWRVRDFMELEDLIHEGFDCLYDAQRRYPERMANEPRRFANTVRLMFRNHIPYLQNRNVRMPEGQLMHLADMCDPALETAFMEKLLGPDELQFVRTLIAEAPAAIKPILEAFTNEAGDIQERLLAPLRQHLDGTRETFNERLCRLIGLDPKTIHLPEAIQDYLSG